MSGIIIKSTSFELSESRSSESVAFGHIPTTVLPSAIGSASMGLDAIAI